MIRPGPLSLPFVYNNLKFVDSPAKMPAPVAGVITLDPDTAYVIVGTVDFNGLRIVGSENSVMYGFSPEYSILKSTGFDDTGGAFITTEFSLPCNYLAFHDFSGQRVLDIDGTGNDAAFDWYGINFVNCQNIGTIANVSNFIGDTFGIIESCGLTFDGSIGTIAFSNSIFTCFDGSTILSFPATLTITRRFRVIYSSFVVTAPGIGIDFSASATAPTEGYILDTINFSGGGTYISGVNSSSNIAMFILCRGISNSATRAEYYMTGNSTATNITVADTFQKLAGTTVAGSSVSKFTVSTSNRATYDGALTELFLVCCSVSFDTVNNKTYFIKLAKNGVIQSAQSIVRGRNTTNLECSLFELVELSTGDYIEIWVASDTTGNTLATDLNLVITRTG